MYLQDNLKGVCRIHMLGALCVLWKQSHEYNTKIETHSLTQLEARNTSQAMHSTLLLWNSITQTTLLDHTALAA